MDWSDSPEQAAFRAEVRAFFQDRMPAIYKALAEEGRDDSWSGGWPYHVRLAGDELRAAAQEWTQALAERGWVAPHWPKEYGGAGLSKMEHFIYNQEMAEANGPAVGGIQAVQMLGPTVIVHGTEEQKRRYLPPILAGQQVWAQGYSEPGAGSDLAGLQTRAVRDGDEYVINGQKIWTSEAHIADMLFALVRTDPEAPKHRGISFLLMDRNTPGISVRPLINAAMKHGFNEVFFEDARVPVGNRLGEENRGWYVGMTLLDFERSGISGSVDARRQVKRLVRHMQAPETPTGWKLRETPALRAEIADRYVETEVGFNFAFRIVSIQNAGMIPNYEASTSKLFQSELSQSLARTGTKALGLHANLWDEDGERTPMHAYFTHRYVTSIPQTIGGGSSEIQRNIIANRGLGLPRG
jgi:alkylation response protein AidB-like acyl-CoA dehydrogenase